MLTFGNINPITGEIIDDSLACTTPGRPYLLGKNPTKKQAIVFQPRCKSWDCPGCAEINKRWWSFAASYHVEQFLSDKDFYFVTLTSHERLSPQQTLDVFPSAWKKLSQRMRRNLEIDLEYFMVLERHKDNRVHAHMITSATMNTRWYKDNARECGFGYMADSQKVTSSFYVSQYVGKYLTKSFTAGEIWPKFFRRVRVSRNWQKPPQKPPSPEWSFEAIKDQISLQYLCEQLSNFGYSVAFMTSGASWQVVDLV